MYNRIKAAGCVWYWDKLDIIPHVNAHVCNDYWEELNNQLYCVNFYDLFRTNYEFNCANTSSIPKKARFGSVEIEGRNLTYARGHTAAQRAPWLKALFREGHPAINTIVGDAQSDYVNRPDVRKALNIPSYLGPYQQCNDQMYTTYKSYREGSVWIYPTLKAYGYKLMHYSGDTDGAIPTLGTRKWIDKQKWKVSRDWTAWTTDDQYAGSLIEYDNFWFATIHGVGHMSPQWKRKSVTSLITNFIHNRPIN